MRLEKRKMKSTATAQFDTITSASCSLTQAVSISPASVETPDYMTMHGIGNRSLVRSKKGTK